MENITKYARTREKNRMRGKEMTEYVRKCDSVDRTKYGMNRKNIIRSCY